MKIWCKHCDDFPEGLCAYCGGDGYTDPPQQILDDLECAEIKRQLKSKGIIIRIKMLDFATRVGVEQKEFFGDTELEALRKAKEWIEGRG